MGRLIAGKTSATTTSLVLNLALVAAIEAADSAGDLPAATRQMWTAGHPLTLAVRSSSAIQPQTVPFVGLKLAAVMAETPPIVTSQGTIEYPEFGVRLEREDNVELQFVVDTDGRANPASITVLNGHYPEFIEALTWSVKESRFRPALAQGCPVPIVIRVSVRFIGSGHSNR